MKRTLKNTAAVLVATALTALAVFAGVQVATFAVGDTHTGTTYTTTASTGATAISTASGGALVCPRTGCTASTCHAVTGLPPGQ